MPDKYPPSTTRLQWTCVTCGRVDIPIEDVVLNLDDPSIAVVKATCPAGHDDTRRLPADQFPSFIREIIREGARIDRGDMDADALVAQVGSFDTWLNSPAFDTERAALRLTGGAVSATGSEASVVAHRILDAHVPPLTFGGLTIDRSGGVEITITGQETLSKAGVALRLRKQGPLVDRWAGIVDDIDVTLRLEIPRGVIPARPRAAA
jgi:hypothetical protein